MPNSHSQAIFVKEHFPWLKDKTFTITNFTDPYIIKEGENALMFDNANVEDMADKIQHICDMPQDELTSWGKRSRELAESMFSTESFVNKYIKLIENI